VCPLFKVKNRFHPLAYSPIFILLGLILVLVLTLHTSSGSVVVPPNPRIFLPAVCVLYICIWLSAPKKSVHSSILMVVYSLALAFASCSLFVASGLPSTHDLYYHQFPTMSLIRLALSRGRWIPRWTNRFWGGVPFLRFYPPLMYHIAALLSWLDPVKTIKFEYILLYLGSSLSMMWVCSKVFRSRPPMFISSLSYSMFGYHLLDSHIRADTGELLAYVWLPLVFWTMFRICEDPKDRRPYLIVVCAFLTFLTILSHILVGFLLILWLGLFGLLLFLESLRNLNKGFKPDIRVLLAVILALGMAAFFLYPAILEKESFFVADLNKGFLFKNFMSPAQFFTRKAWSGPNEFPYTSIESPSWHIYLGNSILYISLVSIVFLGRERRRAFRILLPYLIGTILVSIAFSADLLTPMVRLTFDRAQGVLELFTYIQHPWRTMEICGLASAILSGYSVDRSISILSENRFHMIWRKAFVSVILLIILIDMYPFTGAAGHSEYPYPNISEQKAAEWIKSQRGVFRVHFSEFPPERRLYHFLSAAGYSFMTLTGPYGEWRPKSAYLVRRATREMNYAWRPVTAGFLSVQYIVIYREELPKWERWLDTKDVVISKSFNDIIILENRLFRPFAEVMNSLRDFRAGRVISQVELIELEEEKVRVTVHVEREKLSYLILKINYFEGWVATLDGKPTEVLMTENGLIAVPINRGFHEITLRLSYTSAEILGFLVTGVSLALCMYLYRKRLVEILVSVFTILSRSYRRITEAF